MNRPLFSPGALRRGFLVGIGGCALGAFGGYAYNRFDLRSRLFNPLTLEQFSLPPVPHLLREDGAASPGFSTADLANQTSLVVLFASWCPPCREEHPALMAFAKHLRAPVYAALYRDNPENAVAFLKANGNPFAAVGNDPQGFFARVVGAVGVPTSLVIKPGPRIAARYDGALSAAAFEKKLAPALAD